MSGLLFGSSSIVSGSSTSSESSRRATGRGDGIVYIDNSSIDNMLRDWGSMKYSVDIEFLGRAISRAINEKHWAWLLISKEFYCTIEYGNEGIVIQYFTKKRGINTACAAIMGDSDTVNYDDKFNTSMNFAEILNVVNRMKGTWTGRSYDSINKNCRDFVRELGKQMDSSFDPPHGALDTFVRLTSIIPVDATFPKRRSVK